MNSDIEAYRASSAFWEYTGYLAAAFVILGICIESVELWKHLRRGKSWGKFWEIIGGIIVVVSLLAEILAAERGNNASDLSLGALEQEAADANERAGSADKRAENAIKITDQLKNLNAELAATVEQQKTLLESQNEEMRDFEDSALPRTIDTGDLFGKIAQNLQLKVAIMADNRDESKRLAEQLSIVFSSIPPNKSISLPYDGKPTYNVEILALYPINRAQIDTNVQQAAYILCKYLVEHGVVAGVIAADIDFPAYDWDLDLRENSLMIRIGERQNAFEAIREAKGVASVKSGWAPDIKRCGPIP